MGTSAYTGVEQMTHVIELDEETLALHRRTQSPELAAFYVWWWENRHSEVVSYAGLCHQLSSFMSGLGKWAVSTKAEMGNQFVQCNLPRNYPFGRDEYFSGRINGNMAKDENRIAWVRAHLPDSYKGPR